MLTLFNVDFYLSSVHDPEFAPSIDLLLSETLPALKKVVESGKAKFVGITGYPLSLQMELIERSPVPISTSLVYCHDTLYDQSLRPLLPFFDAHRVDVLTASPLGMGLLAETPSWHPAGTSLRQACSRAADICRQSGVNLARLAIAAAVTQQTWSTTFVGLASAQQVAENVQAVTDGLSVKDEALLQRLQEQCWAQLQPADVIWDSVGDHHERLRAALVATAL